jgi:hypothetical protein
LTISVDPLQRLGQVLIPLRKEVSAAHRHATGVEGAEPMTANIPMSCWPPRRPRGAGARSADQRGGPRPWDRISRALWNWVSQARKDRGLQTAPTTEEIAEIHRLRRAVSDQQRTIEILRAATTLFAGEADPRRR